METTEPISNSQGQLGEPIRLGYDELTKNELRLVNALNQKGRPVMTIKELISACKWQTIGKAKGNSRVRNTLRRLVRGKWVAHPDSVGDGSYRLTVSGAAKLRARKDTD